MPKKDLLSELSQEQLDELLTYTHPFSQKNIDSIKNKTFKKIEEKTIMKKPFLKRSFGTVAAVFAAALVVATTTFAAMHLLRSPSEVIEIAGGNAALTAAFEGSDAININQTITSNGQAITLLALVSGKDISDHPIYNSTGEILNDRTYAILAIKNLDGSPMPSPMDAAYQPLAVSPFINGKSPWVVNVFSMGGGTISVVEDGIMYIIADFTNITKFADRGIYLGVNTGIGMGNIIDAFTLDEESGTIVTSANFDGSSAVFALPVDPSLAQPERASQFLYELFGDTNFDQEQEITIEFGPENLSLYRATYESLNAWMMEQVEARRASGDYDEESLEAFKQEQAGFFDALRDGYYVYIIALDDMGFATAIANPALEYEISVNTTIDGGRVLETIIIN
ncbi:MAG: DUF4179 domain-containing protein [Defluviitaleaceae bacterium]|nr:DUF4179 domain-containing protein [Defluviitaleaceae bacterium]